MSSTESDDRLFTFDDPPGDHVEEWAQLLGGKGAGLARMCKLGLPVPPGFTIPTSVCNRVLEAGWHEGLDAMIRTGLAALETSIARNLGSEDEPLLVSVRSGAPVSMPGMMDTVLNAGMTPATARALSTRSRDPHFGIDTYRRFIESFASVVTEATPQLLAATLRTASGGRALADVPLPEAMEVLDAWRAVLGREGHTIPDDPESQIIEAVRAVFRSWQSDRAAVYRQREGIPSDLGTAANVQAMVFGNLSDESGTGVAFTRDPSTGVSGLMGDFLVRAQGEDVVAGTHATEPIAVMQERWPAIGDELQAMADTLEHDLADMVDIEFTVEHGVLWLLQARVGKRSPRAALRIAVAMANDATFPLDRASASERVAHLLDDPPTEAASAPDAGADVLARGLAASPGRAVGALCIDPDAAVRAEESGQDVILIRPETSPADVHGMAAARGLVTSLGGLVSHAAVVARSWGVPAVVGAADIELSADGITIGGRDIAIGTTVTVDGDQGLLLLGSYPGEGSELAEVHLLRSWKAEAEAIDDEPVTGAGPELDAADHGGAAAARSGELDDATCLRALTLKGMAAADGVADFAGVTADAASRTLDKLVEAGLLQAAPGDRFMMTPEGTAAVEAAYATEAIEAGPAIEPHLDRFHELNARFKQVVTDWQMRTVDGEMVMNEHDDPDYDASVLESLTVEIHEGICEIIASVSETVTRLDAYRSRLTAAVDAIASGDTQMVASPLRDSYHTVWFELHEELIRLSGRNRADEAAAGRA